MQQLVGKLRRFAGECHRVLRVTRKPSKDEFLTIVKVSLLGIAVIGMLGFVLQISKQLLFPHI